MKLFPPVTRNLLFINIILFMVQRVISRQYGDILAQDFGLHFILSPGFRIYQPLTYMFLHADWLHVLSNMLNLWMFGRIMEQVMGQRRFLIYYLICGIGAAFCQELWHYAQLYYNFGNIGLTIGASGACYGVLIAFGLTYPNERVFLLIPPIPLKVKYWVVYYAVFELFSAFNYDSNIAHFAHLGGMFFGWLIFRYWRKQTQRRQSAFQGWNNYAGTQQSGGYGANQGGYQRNYQTSHGNDKGFLQQIRSAFQQMGAAVENFFRHLFGSGSSSAQNRQNSRSSQQQTHNADQAYNAQRRAQQARMDEILDKVRRSGYASLTEDEKQELFKNSRR